MRGGVRGWGHGTGWGPRSEVGGDREWGRGSGVQRLGLGVRGPGSGVRSGEWGVELEGAVRGWGLECVWECGWERGCLPTVRLFL